MLSETSYPLGLFSQYFTSLFELNTNIGNFRRSLYLGNIVKNFKYSRLFEKRFWMYRCKLITIYAYNILIKLWLCILDSNTKAFRVPVSSIAITFVPWLLRHLSLYGQETNLNNLCKNLTGFIYISSIGQHFILFFLDSPNICGYETPIEFNQSALAEEAPFWFGLVWWGQLQVLTKHNGHLSSWTTHKLLKWPPVNF